MPLIKGNKDGDAGYKQLEAGKLQWLGLSQCLYIHLMIVGLYKILLNAASTE
jgi:hypothetical protein